MLFIRLLILSLGLLDLFIWVSGATIAKDNQENLELLIEEDQIALESERDTRKAAAFYQQQSSVKFVPHPHPVASGNAGWAPSYNYPPTNIHQPVVVPGIRVNTDNYRPQSQYRPHLHSTPTKASKNYNKNTNNSPSSPDEEDGRPVEPRDYFPPPHIIKLLEDAGANTLLGLLSDVDMISRFEKKGDYTIFAPTDEAFSMLDQDVIDQLTDDDDLLTQFLQYHVVPNGRIYTAIIKDDLLADSLLEEASLRFNMDEDGHITVNGAEINSEKVDQRASNGVVHFMNEVIYPIPFGTIEDVLTDDSRFTRLIRGLEIAELTELIRDGDSALTIFAPTNEAFEKIPSETLDDLFADKEALRELLLKHIIQGTKLSRSLTFVTLDNMDETEINVRIKKGQVYVENAKLIDGDIIATNGAIQVLDSVLFA